MRKFPWKGLGIGCALLVILVIARCAVTVGRTIYYAGSDWLNKILSDPWFFVGMAAAAVCVVCCLVLASPTKQENKDDEC